MSWTTVALGEVAKIERNVVDPGAFEPATVYLGLEHIESGGRIVSYDTVGRAQLRSAKFTFSADHVLFGKLRPYLGKVALPSLDGLCSTDILPIRPGKDLDRRYLAHFLRQPSVVAFAASRATGASLPRLSPTALAAFEIPLPELVRQRRIAAVLDQAEALRAKRRQSLALLDHLARSFFDTEFEDSARASVHPLGQLAEVVSGLTKGRKLDNQATHTVPYLAVANVQSGHLRLDTVKEIEATETEIERFRLQLGDLVLTEGGDPDKLGRGTLWQDELPLCLHQNHIFRVRIRSDSGVEPQYLAAFIAGRAARSYFLRSAKQTTGIASINMTQLRGLPVVVPSPQSQRRFIGHLERAAALTVSLQHGAHQAEALFASLQSRAFSGDLKLSAS